MNSNYDLSRDLYRQMIAEYHRMQEEDDAGQFNAFISAIAVGMIGSKATQAVPQYVAPEKTERQLSFPFHDDP